MKKYRVAIVGATGAVGREMLRCVIQYHFPYESITCLASSRSKGKILEQDGMQFVVEELTTESFNDIDVAFFSAGGSISKEFVPIAVSHGVVCIDNTSYFRMHKDVPLVVPEVNAEDLKWHHGIIANPNCSTIQMVSALKRLDDVFDIQRIVVSTYQACSGAGNAGMQELHDQSLAVLQDQPVEAHVLPAAADAKHYPIAFNCIPQIDLFDPINEGYTKEEMKMVNETQKMYHKPIDINVTCVRVPVLRGHSESIYIETAKPIDLATAKDLLAHSTGVELMDDISHQIYPMPILNVGSPTVYVGRVRKDLNKENALSLWVVADQLMKGAAYNSIDIGLKMIEMNLL
ncbi:Aspartate-semialdehyde dehydrogenase [Clostridiales bacterium CHKCI006]|nr:Aspartate-semialdehyde dehydrogenase [Clostridiales bacterium CHKCI006]